MELHSYAKRRTPMKWTIEQKRKLVEARITHDSWFTNKPSSVVPWKNILISANLVDFNVFFVRKQWSNMLERYKQYKQTRLGTNATKAIDAEQIRRINQEWEFFEPIHKFMTRKTTNLHSYALTHRTDNDNTNSGQQQKTAAEELVQTSSTTIAEDEDQQVNKTITKLNNETKTINFQKDCAKENIPNNTTIVIQTNNINQDVDGGIHLFSSDTDEEFQIAAGTTGSINVSTRENKKEDEDEHRDCVRNTDHDFYSKKTTLADKAVKAVKSQEDDLHEQQSNYFADASEESQASSNMVVDVTQMHAPLNIVTTPVITIRDMTEQMFEIKSENIIQSAIVDFKEEKQDQEFLNNMPSTSNTQGNAAQLNTENLPTSSTSTSAIRQSERDKYYRHKRHFNRRLEKRFDAILQVMSQIVKVEYPSVDVTPLVGAVTTVASSMGKIVSSDSEDNDNQSDEIDNIPTTTNENK